MLSSVAEVTGGAASSQGAAVADVPAIAPAFDAVASNQCPSGDTVVSLEGEGGLVINVRTGVYHLKRKCRFAATFCGKQVDGRTIVRVAGIRAGSLPAE